MDYQQAENQLAVVQEQTQASLQKLQALAQQMAEYIRRLESDVATHPNPTVQPTGWANQPQAGGGFLSSLTSGLGMGAGFAVADDLVGDLFNMF